MGPKDRAYSALAAGLAGALVGSGLLEGIDGLKIDPAFVLEPTGEADEVLRWAALVGLDARVVKTVMGGPRPSYVVEIDARLEVALVSPNADWRAQVETAALAAVAALPEANPTLGGTAERFFLSEFEPDDLPPNGRQALITFTLRFRSGDRLGLSDPSN